MVGAAGLHGGPALARVEEVSNSLYDCVILPSKNIDVFCKAKRQYLLTCKVSRYCLLALHGSIVMLRNPVSFEVCGSL